MSSPSGPKPGASIELTSLGKKGGAASGEAGGSGKSKTTFSGVGVKVGAKGTQVNTNQDGHKTSLRTTANTMKMKTGNDQVAFDFSKGQLSIKTGDTHFTLGRGKDGLNMAATDLKSKTKSTMDISGNKVTRTLESPQKKSRSVSEDPHLGALASKHGQRLGQVKSPLAAFGAGAFGGNGVQKELGFSAFKRETKSGNGSTSRTTTEQGVFAEMSTSKGKGKQRQTEHSAFGVAERTKTESNSEGEFSRITQRRAAFHHSTNKGRKE